MADRERFCDEECTHVEADPAHPGEPCCTPPTGGKSEALAELSAPPEGAYVPPQDETRIRNVGKAEGRRRRGGRVVSLSALMAVAEREFQGRSKL